MAVVSVVLSVDTVADYKDLHVLKQSAVHPERMPLVAVDLVESLFQLQPPTFELDLHQGQAVNEQGNIVAVFVGAFLGDLVGDLKKVFCPIFIVKETHIEALAIVAVQLKTVAQGFGFFEHIAFSQVVEDGAKLLFRKRSIIEGFYLAFQVGQYAVLITDMNIFIPKTSQLLD
ncbi:hypothetical protein ES708_20138 [subsurface metagenome]